MKSFVLKNRGTTRGTRLIDRDSLDLFFQMEAAKAEAAEKKSSPEVESPTSDPIRKSLPGR